MAEGAALVHENLGSNVVYQHAFTFGDVDAEFAAADRVVRRELRWPRATAAPLETNGAVVRFDAASGRMDVWSNTNLLNFGAWVMSATLGVAPHMLNFHPMYGGRRVRLEALPRPSRSASRGRWPRSPAGP